VLKGSVGRAAPVTPLGLCLTEGRANDKKEFTPWWMLMHVARPPKGLEECCQIMLWAGKKERCFMGKAPGWTHRPAVGGLLGVALWCTGPSLLHAQGSTHADSRPPVPRFASLKSDKVQLHHGPGTEFPVAWVFRRAGLPVEITRETDTWSEVRDAEGTTGWVWTTALSRRRTALVLPGQKKAQQGPQETVALRDDDSTSASTIANVEAGVLANIIDCNGRWCRVSVGTFRGYVEQSQLWGTRLGEVIK
jgi:SH3-like domain-containing protein